MKGNKTKAKKNKDFGLKWTIPHELWEQMLAKDNIETVQKLFHLLSQSQKKRTLEIAGERNHFKMVNFLVNAVIFESSEWIEFFNMRIYKWKSIEITKLAINASKTLSLNNLLRNALSLKNEELATYLIQEKSDRLSETETIRFFEEPIIFTVCRYGYLNLLKLLINKGWKLDVRLQYGYSLLSNSTHAGSLEIVKCLVDNGADPLSSDSVGGIKPFGIACRQGHLKLAQYFLERGADCDEFYKSAYTTPLLLACSTGQLDIVKFLIQNKVDYNNKTDEVGATPLIVACSRKHKDVVKFLISQQGIDLDRSNFQGVAPLFILSREVGNFELMRSLIEKGANANKETSRKETPLFNAIRYCDLEMTKMLVEQGKADLNHKNWMKETPLQVALFGKKMDIANYLIEMGAK